MQMDCPTEEALIRKKLGEMAAVRSLEFNLMQRVLTVVHTPESLEQILAALRSLGVSCCGRCAILRRGAARGGTRRESSLSATA